MAQREAPVVEMLFQRQPVDARLAGAGQVGFIDFEDAIEGAHIDHQLALLWAKRAAHPSGAAERRDRGRVSRGPAEDGRDLLAAGGPSYEHSRRGLARAL